MLYLFVLFSPNIQAKTNEADEWSMLDSFLQLFKEKPDLVDVTDPKAVGKEFILLLKDRRCEEVIQHVREKDREGFLYACYNEIQNLPPIPDKPQVIVRNIKDRGGELSIQSWVKEGIGFDLIWLQNRWWIRK